MGKTASAQLKVDDETPMRSKPGQSSEKSQGLTEQSAKNTTQISLKNSTMKESAKTKQDSNVEKKSERGEKSVKDGKSEKTDKPSQGQKTQSGPPGKVLPISSNKNPSKFDIVMDAKNRRMARKHKRMLEEGKDLILRDGK